MPPAKAGDWAMSEAAALAALAATKASLSLEFTVFFGGFRKTAQRKSLGIPWEHLRGLQARSHQYYRINKHVAAKRATTPPLAASDEQHAIASACAEKQHGALSLRQQVKGEPWATFQPRKLRGKLQKQNNKTPAPHQPTQVHCESRHDRPRKINQYKKTN